jgi:drug/metabolite transporter (DMT)-like permease
MANDLVVATFAGLGGMVGWGAADFLAKKTIDEIGDLPTLFWSQAIGVAPLVAIFVVTRDVPTLHTYDLAWLALFGVVSALSYVSLYAGFAKGRISLLSPIFASYAAVVVVVSAVAFGEHIPGRQWTAIVVVLLGVLLISTDPADLTRVVRNRADRDAEGIREVLSAAVAYAFWLVLLDHFIGERDWVFFLLVIRSTASVTVAVYARATRQPLTLRSAHRSLAIPLGWIGLFDVAAFSAVSYGFSATTYTSIVALLSSAFSLPTLLLARVFLKERLVSAHKIAASAILVGIALVTLN